MRRSLLRIGKVALWLLVALSPFGCIYLVLGLDVCITETRMRIPGLAGFDFEVNETDCDTLAKDAAISVFVSKAGHGRKALLIKYGPYSYPNDLPLITQSGTDAFDITIKRVSDIVCYNRTWKGLHFNYDISFVEYPSAITDCE
jgi:hypothetical protein